MKGKYQDIVENDDILWPTNIKGQRHGMCKVFTLHFNNAVGYYHNGTPMGYWEIYNLRPILIEKRYIFKF